MVIYNSINRKENMDVLELDVFTKCKARNSLFQSLHAFKTKCEQTQISVHSSIDTVHPASCNKVMTSLLLFSRYCLTQRDCYTLHSGAPNNLGTKKLRILFYSELLKHMLGLPFINANSFQSSELRKTHSLALNWRFWLVLCPWFPAQFQVFHPYLHKYMWT